MTRKDYEKIAAVFADYKRYSENWNSAFRMTAIREFAPRICDMLAQDNPRFDRARFLKACGIAGE